MQTLVVFFGTYVIYAVAIVGAGAWILSPHHNRRRILAIAMVAIIVTAVLGAGAGLIFSHPQPFAVEGFEPLIPHEVDNAFPSHHTLAAGVAAAVVFLFNRRLGVVLFLAAIAIGWGRVAAGLHLPIDVLASLAIATLGTCLASLVVSRFLPPMLESKDISSSHGHGTTDTI